MQVQAKSSYTYFNIKFNQKEFVLIANKKFDVLPKMSSRKNCGLLKHAVKIWLQIVASLSFKASELLR